MLWITFVCGASCRSTNSRAVTLSIFSYMKNPSRLEARWTNPPAALVLTCSVGLMRVVVSGAVHCSSNLLRCVYYLRFVKNRVCFTFINFLRRDVFINNNTYVQQYTTKYMKIENDYIFPVLMVLLSLLFIFYIHNLIPFFRIHGLITFSTKLYS